MKKHNALYVYIEVQIFNVITQRVIEKVFKPVLESESEEILNKKIEDYQKVYDNNEFNLISQIYHLEDFKGLTVSVLEPKDIGNCSNNGVTNNFDSLYVCDANSPKIFNPDYWEQILIVDYVSFGNSYKSYYLKPFVKKHSQTMFGGCYAITSDSRFKDIVGESAPLRIHDRVE